MQAALDDTSRRVQELQKEVAGAREKALREAANACQKRADSLMHEDGSYDESTNSWSASSRVQDHIEGWDEAKEAILALFHARDGEESACRPKLEVL